MEAITFQSSTFLIQNYSQNQCQYCLTYDFNKSRRNLQKKDFFQVTLEDPISKLTLIKLNFECYRKGLKCKQLEENLQSIQRELKINNHKVDHGLNEDFVEIVSSNSGKITPFVKLFWE